MQDNFTVVLIEPQNSHNIGAILRAMSNFEFKKIRIVNPQSYDLNQIRASACWGDDLIEKIEIHSSFESALDDQEDVWGFSSESGRNKLGNYVLSDFLETRVPEIKKTALVFGREDSGLTNEHLKYCRYILRIPSSAKNSSLNLSQAAMLVFYELARKEFVIGKAEEYPTWNEFFQLERIITESSNKVNFYRDGTPEPIPAVISSMFKRLNPTKREMGILLALFSRINKRL